MRDYLLEEIPLAALIISIGTAISIIIVKGSDAVIKVLIKKQELKREERLAQLEIQKEEHHLSLIRHKEEMEARKRDSDTRADMLRKETEARITVLRRERDQTVKHYEELLRIHRQTEINLRTQIDHLETKTMALTDTLAKRESEIAAVRADLRITQAAVQHMQQKYGDGDTSLFTDGVLLTDAIGVILAANSYITDIFGWEVRELLGKNVDILIPQRYRTRHDMALTMAIQSGTLPWTDKVLRPVCGVRKDGTEVPLTIRISMRKRGTLIEFAAMIMLRDDGKC
jgi:PAS domain S-box-containing protein